MKKLTAILLTFLMLALIGCPTEENKSNNDTTISTADQQNGGDSSSSSDNGQGDDSSSNSSGSDNGGDNSSSSSENDDSSSSSSASGNEGDSSSSSAEQVNDNAVLFTTADIAEDKIQWDGDNGLVQEIKRYEREIEQHPKYHNYEPIDWSKAFPDNTTDWSKVKDVTIDLADVDTVDVIGATVLKRYIDAKLEEVGKTKEDIENIVHFTDYATDAKLNLDFKKLGEKGLSNVEFMNAIFDVTHFSFDERKMKQVPDDYTWYGEDTTSDKIDNLIPGVDLVTFPNEYNGVCENGLSISQAFNFTSDAVVTMPKDPTYDLTGAYKGGILGDVTIDINGLKNATMSGEIYKHDIKGIYDTFVKDKTDLPTLNIKLLDRPSDINDNINLMNRSINGGYQELNIYGTKIDELIETYYRNGKAGDFTLKNLAGSCLSFDSSEYVLTNGGSMYQEQGNEPTGNTYKLGINAALVMAQAGMNISDVNVVDQSYDAVDSRNPIFGAGDDAATQDFVNVRFEADMSRFSFSSNTRSAGIIDIAGPAPQNLPEGNGHPVVIVRKEAVKDGHRAYLDAVAYGYDLRDLSADEVSRAPAGMASWILYSADGYPANPAGNEYVDGDVNFTKPSIKEIEQGARDGKELSDIENEHNNHASVSPKKMKEKKDANLMRAILNGKDKEYS